MQHLAKFTHGSTLTPMTNAQDDSIVTAATNKQSLATVQDEQEVAPAEEVQPGVTASEVS